MFVWTCACEPHYQINADVKLTFCKNGRQLFEPLLPFCCLLYYSYYFLFKIIVANHRNKHANKMRANPYKNLWWVLFCCFSPHTHCHKHTPSTLVKNRKKKQNSPQIGRQWWSRHRAQRKYVAWTFSCMSARVNDWANKLIHAPAASWWRLIYVQIVVNLSTKF